VDLEKFSIIWNMSIARVLCWILSSAFCFVTNYFVNKNFRKINLFTVGDFEEYNQFQTSFLEQHVWNQKMQNILQLYFFSYADPSGKFWSLKSKLSIVGVETLLTITKLHSKLIFVDFTLKSSSEQKLYWSENKNFPFGSA
jgi:hypothetical protein